MSDCPYCWDHVCCCADDDGLLGMDEDCADGLHEYCLTDTCICHCHVPELAAQGRADNKTLCQAEGTNET
jgi:hypothetical protein